ncbi:MAG TPA: aldo/keto reductase [Anaerolineaceae bacterium]|nr:aldo/keto reductase [Anaerolineaceae bacterium]
METRTLGRTGLVVTPIGLGLAALGRPGYINLKHGEDLQHEYSVEAMQAHAHSVLDAAWDAGIRYFDAARSYGRAEVYLASWLSRRAISPQDATVGSKWGYTYTAEWKVDAQVHEVKDLSLAVLRRQRAESDANLDGYLKLYQIHSATLESGIFENLEVLKELAAYRQAGLAIGLTLSGPRQAETLQRAMQIRLDGQPVFDSVQATWNLLEPSAGKALQAAHQEGMGVIVKEALANGRLTEKNDDPEFAPRRALLEATAMDLNASLDSLCLAAVLAQPWADVVLSGAATREQLASNVTALNVPWTQANSDRLAVVCEPPEQYWAGRSALPWI